MRRMESILALAIVASWTSASGQGKTTDAGRTPVKPGLTAEESEIIRNRELLDNLELLDDFESVRHMKLLAPDRTTDTKTQPAGRKEAKSNAKKKKNP